MSSHVIDASRAARNSFPDESSPSNVILFPSGAAIVAVADAALASLVKFDGPPRSPAPAGAAAPAELYVLLVHAERIRRQLGNPPRAGAAYWQRMLPDLIQMAADPGRGLGAAR